ncbi:MAG: DoxX family membrane protein [Sporocytophaga sp.]|uniref:DoxX family protein n=1 Tax=Sporocytophaga sp. TaxID=2231183 RepID=UPI001B12F688|nr:DoxX family membrane protein [Sporocytophaga sp.]MBO9701810.1 DoxX family membrane protein [Sporocytophaga sp.]
MKIATIVVRVLLGLMMAFAGVVFLFKLGPQPELTGPMKTFFEGMNASGYLLPVVKTIELVCGLALITGFFAPLATVVIFPIIVNIVLVNVFLAPEQVPMAIAILAANLFLAFVYRKNYESILALR